MTGNKTRLLLPLGVWSHRLCTVAKWQRLKIRLESGGMENPSARRGIRNGLKGLAECMAP